MNYELIRRLKDSGFPQREDLLLTAEDKGTNLASLQYRQTGFHRVYDSSIGESLEELRAKPVSEWQGKGRGSIHFAKEYLESREGKELTVYQPTLSELIEACGDKAQYIAVVRGNGFYYSENRKYQDIWQAYQDDHVREIEGRGNTPEEAVASLYIKLHEKK